MLSLSWMKLSKFPDNTILYSMVQALSKTSGLFPLLPVSIPCVGLVEWVSLPLMVSHCGVFYPLMASHLGVFYPLVASYWGENYPLMASHWGANDPLMASTSKDCFQWVDLLHTTPGALKRASCNWVLCQFRSFVLLH